MADPTGIFCSHCSSWLSRKSYVTHKRLYHNKETNQWIKKCRLTTEYHHRELAITEEAVEECDYGFSTDQLQQDSVITSSIDNERDSPPPLVDFEEDNSMDLHVDEPQWQTAEAEGNDSNLFLLLLILLHCPLHCPSCN